MQSKKRFTETNIWELTWFSKLTPKHKLLWFYINDKCDNIGVWEPNFELAAYFLKVEIDIETFMNDFLTYVNFDEDRVHIFGNGLWFLPQFVKFQYAKGKPLNPNNSAHKSYLRQLNERNLLEWFLENQPEVLLPIDDIKESSTRPLLELYKSHKDKGKDLEKDKDMGKEIVKEADKGKEIAMDNEYILDGISNNQLLLNDEEVNKLDFVFDYEKSVERILTICPNHFETEGFDIFIMCKNILTDLIKSGLTCHMAEKTLKNEIKKAIDSEPSVKMEDHLEIIHNSLKSGLKMAV